ncbi:MAG: 23S rRNA (guanosine(2251)-2'-O)-methyltransferase RlmB [Ruminococcus sp.]|jgi:23S rRNA (guanosine2251-2'-O)-methyltransferase|nr:23S rRNA (guanosine(2251)-2'-O)-methyltransferase RlmB [Ruminococcus sp.]
MKDNTQPYQNDELLIGRNPINEALASGRSVIKVMIAKGSTSGAAVEIAAKAKKAGVPVQEVERKKLDFMTNGAAHQGVAALCAMKDYATVEDILRLAQERGEAPFIILLDEIEDPHNLGAIIRSAECAGAHGVIVKKRRSAGLTYTAYKASAGALEYVPVARVTNIADTIDDLKARNIWVYGADMDGEDYRKTNFSGGVALVIGNEGKGISRLVREKCDVIVSLPLKGRINSLNASVAAGILMYKVAETR